MCPMWVQLNVSWSAMTQTFHHFLFQLITNIFSQNTTKVITISKHQTSSVRGRVFRILISILDLHTKLTQLY